MPKITNPNYQKFLKDGIIDPITEEQLHHALQNIKGQNHKEGRALLITLYYTGCRPAEAIQLKGEHIDKENNYITIKIPGGIKKSLPRTIYLAYKHPAVKELYAYAKGRFPGMYLFHNYKNRYIRTIRKHGKEITRIETTDKIRYHIKKWFTGIVPGSITTYFLRHNRFSKLAIAGADDRDLRQLKGSRTYESITPYIHMTAKSSKKIAKKIK